MGGCQASGMKSVRGWHRVAVDHGGDGWLSSEWDEVGQLTLYIKVL